MRRIELKVTTAADGTATAFFNKANGKIHSVHYVKDATTAFTDGVDFAVTTETTGENIWTEQNVNASTVRYPRAPTHTQAGVAAGIYATGGAAVADKIAIANDRIKVVIAQGGNAKKGKFVALVD